MRVLSCVSFAMLLTTGCGGDELQNNSKNDTDSVNTIAISDTIQKIFPQPLDLQSILESDLVQWTNSVEVQSEMTNYWRPDTKGFFGSYNLLKKQYISGEESPYLGMAITYVAGIPENWKLGQITEWLVHLEIVSDELYVWDSIHVGTSREYLNHALENVEHYIDGERITAEFTPYHATFVVTADTVSLITIDRVIH